MDHDNASLPTFFILFKYRSLARSVVESQKSIMEFKILNHGAPCEFRAPERWVENSHYREFYIAAKHNLQSANSNTNSNRSFSYVSRSQPTRW